ncbi:MAG: DUF4381 domain-containing protein [Zetaproteobacteria bacterium CG12_big_fil_rev_8_21_14_0_65_54_13]|nr:MAG: DUF4381 domain-containing protein [Zetaproteobacteria bacterium CG12_big_fil_rev_8_21_14_0_65_54_13]PIX55745.1 MAG: DUF4381 domain-containing protein [Zetaproteobacteria bacterium CG_4_10_14_3_um_filter_54_28]PJA30557.1 MAG: DUF4381 domain-containing protein [Zetaproteobacteria bacterium CG_4_9_14_3_um_filter_54_145]
MAAANPDALSQLRDIHLPQMISWWPPAPGWWLLLVTACLLVAGCWYLWRRRRSTYRKPALKTILTEALREFDHVNSALQSGESSAMAELSVLMRRVAVQLDSEAAGVTGEAWLQWLDSRWQQQDFTAGAGRALVESPYRAVSAADALALSCVCRDWLEAQR